MRQTEGNHDRLPLPKRKLLDQGHDRNLGARIPCSSLGAYTQGAELHRPEGQTSKATLRLSNRRSAHLLETRIFNLLGTLTGLAYTCKANFTIAYTPPARSAPRSRM